MPNRCVAPGCKVNYDSCKEKCSMFAAPKEEERRLLWQRANPRKDFVLKPSHYLCEKHFHEENIVRKITHKDQSDKIIAQCHQKLIWKMLPVIFTVLRTYAPYITLPVAAVIGFIGYKIEGVLSDRYTPYEKSIEEKREDRFVEESLKKNTMEFESLKTKRFVPFSVLQKNVSPSLDIEDK